MKHLLPRIELGGRRLKNSLLDLLYPPFCALCETPLREGKVICEECSGGFLKLEKPFCEICGEGYPGAIDGQFACPNCKGRRYGFAFARPAFFRSEPLLELIHRLKYSREIHLARGLGEVACEAFSDTRLSTALAEKWPLVPVPLHRRRLQERHFNQAHEISRAISDRMDLPLLPALHRTRHTKTQTLLSRAERLANLKQAFELSRAGKQWLAQGKTAGAVLVDDVFTTGSTVNACAKILRRAGFQKVIVVTVMRG